MGLRREISCIFHNSIKETIKIFKEEVVSISSTSMHKNRNEVYTYAFSRYDDYKVYTEKIYVMVYPNTIMFLWSPVAVALFLDDKLQVNGGDSGELKPEDSLIFDFIESPNIDYLGSIFNNRGELFEAFTIKDKVPRNNAEKLFETRNISIDDISADEDDVIYVSMEFLKYQIEKFNTQIEASLGSEEDPHPSLDENPFANKYYDNDVIPIEDKKPIGDQNV